MTERKDWIKCIAHTHQARAGYSWCGRFVHTEFHFVDLDHAAYERLNQGRLVPCTKCMARAVEALKGTTPEPILQKWKEDSKEYNGKLNEIGRAYYMNREKGNNKNHGLTPCEAWQNQIPKDKLAEKFTLYIAVDNPYLPMRLHRRWDKVETIVQFGEEAPPNEVQ